MTRGCRVIDRPIPISDVAALMSAWAKLGTEGDEWICCGLLADYLKVALVCGPTSEIFKWRAELGLYRKDQE